MIPFEDSVKISNEGHNIHLNNGSKYSIFGDSRVHNPDINYSTEVAKLKELGYSVEAARTELKKKFGNSYYDLDDDFHIVYSEGGKNKLALEQLKLNQSYYLKSNKRIPILDDMVETLSQVDYYYSNNKPVPKELSEKVKSKNFQDYLKANNVRYVTDGFLFDNETNPGGVESFGSGILNFGFNALDKTNSIFGYFTGKENSIYTDEFNRKIKRELTSKEIDQNFKKNNMNQKTNYAFNAGRYAIPVGFEIAATRRLPFGTLPNAIIAGSTSAGADYINSSPDSQFTWGDFFSSFGAGAGIVGAGMLGKGVYQYKKHGKVDWKEMASGLTEEQRKSLKKNKR